MLFGKKTGKEQNSRYVLAVQNFDAFFDGLEKGEFHLPADAKEYRDLFATSTTKATQMKELNGFIRKVGVSKKDCYLYWEGLILDGYTLFDVKFDKTSEALAALCDGKVLKFLTKPE